MIFPTLRTPDTKYSKCRSSAECFERTIGSKGISQPARLAMLLHFFVVINYRERAHQLLKYHRGR